MADHVRWGIMGAAKFARDHMGPAIHMAQRGALAAVASSSAEKAAPFVARTPGVRVLSSENDYEALISDPEIDAIYIPLPNHLHLEAALRAVAAGKHVLVEKPLAMRADGFDPLILERDRQGKLVAEAYMIVHHPQWQKVRELVQGGEIGKLVRVSGAFSYDNRADTANIRNKPETGGGAIPDIGVYIYGATRFVTGEEPQEILSAEIVRENGVDVWSHITARFPSFHYTGLVSMRMSPWQDMTFHGEKGLIRLTAPFNAQVYGEARIELHRPAHEVVEWRFPAANHYVNQVEAFNASVLDGVDYPCPLEFSRGTQAMIDMVWAKEAG
ncbi:Gfo/Idh/MocA family protein [Primorskyibacter sp. 2E107]|uniref:Gfo/Idh/MocA family protein n=1 Tax=Primorskyibacter sp. 2E107 TaxID=3403458 RepID=UPI003AF8722F